MSTAESAPGFSEKPILQDSSSPAAAKDEQMIDMKSKVPGWFKALVKQALMQTETGEKILLSYSLHTFLEKNGWLRSVREQRPVTHGGQCIPWFTYPSIYFLEERVRPGFDVFEYGSGNSTIWWGKKVHSVTSCEHNLEWYNEIKSKVPQNVTLMHHNLSDGDAYSEAILDFENAFDIIVVDGRDRVECAKNSPKALRDGGVIIWDNSSRERYQEGRLYLKENGFEKLDFTGLAPIVTHNECTSIYYRENNCLNV